MNLTIRRSRQDEGDKLVSIWCRSVDATHHFLSADYRIIGLSWRSWYVHFYQKPLCGLQ